MKRRVWLFILVLLAALQSCVPTRTILQEDIIALKHRVSGVENQLLSLSANLNQIKEEASKQGVNISELNTQIDALILKQDSVFKVIDSITNAGKQNKTTATKSNYQTKRTTAPSYSSSSSSRTSSYRSSTFSRSSSYTGRCMAITKAGTRCKRTAQAGSSYCWQHQ